MLPAQLYHLNIDFTYHSIVAINKAAIDFTQKKLLKKNGSFTFNKLMPAQRIISKIPYYPESVTLEDLQEIKVGNADRINTKF